MSNTPDETSEATLTAPDGRELGFLEIRLFPSGEMEATLGAQCDASENENPPLHGALVSKFYNEKPIEHRTQYGTVFTCSRGDLRKPVLVQNSGVANWSNVCHAKFASEVAEFTAWHFGSIWPRLNGFRGYDCIHFEFT